MNWIVDMNRCTGPTPKTSQEQTMKSLVSPGLDEIVEAMVDVTAPQHVVEVQVHEDNSVLWVNVDGVCILRICRIPKLTVVWGNNQIERVGAGDGEG
jgi:hypothetical protein